MNQQTNNIHPPPSFKNYKHTIKKKKKKAAEAKCRRGASLQCPKHVGVATFLLS